MYVLKVGSSPIWGRYTLHHRKIQNVLCQLLSKIGCVLCLFVTNSLKLLNTPGPYIFQNISNILYRYLRIYMSQSDQCCHTCCVPVWFWPMCRHRLNLTCFVTASKLFEAWSWGETRLYAYSRQQGLTCYIFTVYCMLRFTETDQHFVNTRG